jgi:cobalt-zinc-cadmium efflux system membrane fusion protein
MSCLLSGRLRGLILITFLFIAGLPAHAHEGHDHGVPQTQPPTMAMPRIALQSDPYQLVAILRNDTLTVHLDAFATNEPVTDATISVTIGAEDVAARAIAAGLFQLASPKLAGAGALELVFAISGPMGDDLLIGTLQRPTALRDAHAHLSSFWIAGGSLAAGLVLGAALTGWRRRAMAPAAAILVGLLLPTDRARAHEGHDHGAPPPAVVSGDAPQRLPDRSVFLPKASQHLLDIRTRVTANETAQKGMTLVGRIIVDPNRGGLVQSISGGRILAAEGGLPRLGQQVKRGDLLALIEPALPQADRTTISERSGEIEQAIAVAEARLRRLRPLAERGIAPQSQIVDAETELEGLRRRREIVRETRVEPEALRAAVDGVIAAAKVQAGQVVQPQDVLFQIVDPQGLIVEALAFPDVLPTASARASAVATDGTGLRLRLLGYGRALQQQATLVHFAIEDAPDHLSVGQPVTVTATTGADVSGIILPRDALVRGANGEQLVWRHVEPERFEPVAVRSEMLDAGRIIIRAGVKAGERIVVRGADLINQVR